MKKNELMFGDYVMWHSDVYKVTCVSTDMVTIQGVHNGITMLTRYDKLQPLSLTSDILKENLFEVINDLYGMLMYLSRVENDTIIQIEDNRLAEYPAWHVRTMTKSKKKSCDIRKDIDYIHELQHILRLADSPFEILL